MDMFDHILSSRIKIMKIYKKLGLNFEKQNVISFIGAGGKSTSMNLLAKELKDIGKKVLVTTTTVLFGLQHRNSDECIVGSLPEEYKPKDGTITFLVKTMEDNKKTKGPSIGELEEIYNRDIFDVILIEADGAKRKPITASADHEPVVPSFATMTIGIIGLDSIGLPLDEDHIHRPEILKKIFNVELPHRIEEEDIVKLIIDGDGIFKRTYGEKVIFLNKAHNDERLEIGQRIRRELEREGMKNVYITNVKTGKIY